MNTGAPILAWARLSKAGLASLARDLSLSRWHADCCCGGNRTMAQPDNY